MSTSTKQSPNGKVRYAVVGLGHIAQVAVLPAFKSAQNSELATIVTGDAEKRKSLAEKYKVERAFSYEEYEQVLRSVDAVYIALPNHLHRDYAIRAAEAGVHVLCEKPMAVTEQDCEAMMAAADKAGVKLMIAYRLHFEAGTLDAIETAKSRKLGDLRIFDSVFTQQVTEGNVRVTASTGQGGGPVYDMGVYCINAARYLFQAEPTSVLAASAKCREKRFEGIDEMTCAIMRFPDERLATFTCSFGAADTSRYTLIGTKGVLTADPAYEYSTGINYDLTIDGKTSTKRFQKRDQFAAELVYFSDCILQNKQPEPSGQEGLADVRIVRAIYESARSGKVVDLPEFSVRKRASKEQETSRPAHGKPETVKAQSPSGEAA